MMEKSKSCEVNIPGQRLEVRVDAAKKFVKR